MTQMKLDTMIQDLREAITEVGELLEQKNARFQELGIDAEELDQILTGKHADSRLRHQVLQELNSMDRNLTDQVTDLAPQPVVHAMDYLVHNYQTV